MSGRIPSRILLLALGALLLSGCASTALSGRTRSEEPAQPPCSGLARPAWARSLPPDADCRPDAHARQEALLPRGLYETCTGRILPLPRKRHPAPLSGTRDVRSPARRGIRRILKPPFRAVAPVVLSIPQGG